ncbi:MAG: cell division protein ZapE [Xanthomonadales bacterium]|nr:cell division protein ZapE [Xanthomonadales bacterium]
MHQSPLSHYQRLLRRGDFSPDPQQQLAIQALDGLWQVLCSPARQPLLKRLLAGRPVPPRGIYLWGGVGRGKTWLMDLFFEQLPTQQKQRLHFHRFMQRVHAGLRAAKQARDPLSRVANDWAKNCTLLCLDEFFVSDIADAMLLAGLLENLFRNGVTLVATSNTPPDRLYEGGLQRERFLPAIDLLERNMEVLELKGETDFRLRILEQSKIFHHPLDNRASAALTASFNRMAAECELDHDLDINGRIVHALRRGDGVIWFEFSELCKKPTGSIDFIEIARAFNTVIISGTPRLDDRDANAARRFITLIDEFYDRNVKLLMSAEVPVEQLYTGRRLAFEYQRSASRLIEMQSHDYLARPHLP